MLFRVLISVLSHLQTAVLLQCMLLCGLLSVCAYSWLRSTKGSETKLWPFCLEELFRFCITFNLAFYHPRQQLLFIHSTWLLLSTKKLSSETRLGKLSEAKRSLVRRTKLMEMKLFCLKEICFPHYFLKLFFCSSRSASGIREQATFLETRPNWFYAVARDSERRKRNFIKLHGEYKP